MAKTTGPPRNLKLTNSIVLKTREIIEYLQPEVWRLENPRTGLLKGQGLLDDAEFIDADYCQFAPWGYRKPTRIWGNGLSRLSHVTCDDKTCPNMVSIQGNWRHRHLLEGSRVSLKHKNRIPPRLVEYAAGWSSPPDLDELREEAKLQMLEEAKEYTSKALNPRRARRRPQSLAQFQSGQDIPDLVSASDSESDELFGRTLSQYPKVALKPSHINICAEVNRVS